MSNVCDTKIWIAIYLMGIVACNSPGISNAPRTDSAREAARIASTKQGVNNPSSESSANTVDNSASPKQAQAASATNAKATMPNSASSVEMYGRYMVKSGYVEMESTRDIGTDLHAISTVKKTFDNYGRDELMEITTETTINGSKKMDNERFLMRAGWMHTLRPDFIAARQHPYSQFDLQNMEFSLLDADAMHLYNIKSMGNEFKDGRTCAHYRIDYHSKDGDMKGDMWTYKNLFYGMDVTMGDVVIRSKITHFDENVNVAQSKFDIPAGYRVIDADNAEN